jgi:hypothetical protein
VAVDLMYVGKGRISLVYLLDAPPQTLFVATFLLTPSASAGVAGAQSATGTE